MSTNHGSVVISFAGDVCLGEHYFNCGSGFFSQRPSVNRLKSALNFDDELTVGWKSDLLVFNLECPVSLVGLNSASIHSRCFRGKPEDLNLLPSGVPLLASIANNHICQHGLDAYGDTLTNLQYAKIDFVGKAPEGSAAQCTPEYKSINGVRCVFLSWSLVPEQFVSPNQIPYPFIFNFESLAQVTQVSMDADLVVVSLHTGEEGAFKQEHLTGLVRAVADAGATVVAVHHSHIFHKIEKWNNSVIFYGLGNFIFDLLWDRAMTLTWLGAIKFSKAKGIDKIYLRQCKLSPNGLPEIVTSQEMLIIDMASHASGAILFDPMNSFQRLVPLQVKKALYFFAMLPQGCSKLKCGFLFNKLKGRISVL